MRERTFVLDLVDGHHRGPGCIHDLFTARFGPAAPPTLPDTVPLGVASVS